MTKREFFEAVISADLDKELTQFAADSIEKMDEANAKRVEKNAEKAVERELERAPIREAILGCITNEPKTATTLIAEAEVDLKPQAIPSLLKGLVEDGTIAKGFVKVKGKSKQVGYFIEDAEGAEDTEDTED